MSGAKERAGLEAADPSFAALLQQFEQSGGCNDPGGFLRLQSEDRLTLDFGGTERRVADLARSFGGRGHHLTVHRRSA